MGLDKELLWQNFCKRQQVIENSVPLFSDKQGCVETFANGKNQHCLLKRHEQMDTLVIHEVKKVLADFKQSHEYFQGLIYMMFWPSKDGPIPLYIGKSEKYGRNNKNLSANIKDIEKNHGKFCRWGYNYAYHIGDLSAWVCPEHASNKQLGKYKVWADKLFQTPYPSEKPRLKQETRFWMKAWGSKDIGPWEDFGVTNLTFLEYLMIGLASKVFAETLLNIEGVNR